MPWMIPAAIIASSIYSANQQGDAVEDAARAQGNASARAMQFQRNALLSNLTQGYPVYRGQINALNRLYSMQGLPSIRAPEFDSIVSPFRPNATSQPRPGQPTPEQVNAARDRAREFAVTGF